MLFGNTETYNRRNSGELKVVVSVQWDSEVGRQARIVV